MDCGTCYEARPIQADGALNHPQWCGPDQTGQRRRIMKNCIHCTPDLDQTLGFVEECPDCWVVTGMGPRGPVGVNTATVPHGAGGADHVADNPGQRYADE